MNGHECYAVQGVAGYAGSEKSEPRIDANECE
ncbi:MAG: hypothetical protein ACI8T1_001855 [Verrucomicrobiales bacterium]|jgi:hypothetical protein